MPKKVITRRQRKAAEAKRMSNERVHLTAAPEEPNRQVVMQPPSPLDLQPSCSSVRPDSLPASTDLDQPIGKRPTVKSTGVETDKHQVGKATVTIVLSDNKTQTDKKKFESEDDESIPNQLDNPLAGVPQHPALPSTDEGSFSKSLSRKAAATITKIQKLSKVFNKKFNYKQSSSKGVEPNIASPNEIEDMAMKNGLSGPCNCEFCKAVFGQLLTGKKRANEKKLGKASGRRMGNPPRRSASPVQSINPQAQQVKAKCGEGQAVPPIEGTRRRIMKMLEKKEKRMGKDVAKKVMQTNKLEPQISEREQTYKGDPTGQALLPNSEKYKYKLRAKKSKRAALPEPSSVVEPTKTAQNSFSTKANFLSAIQQVSAEQRDAPPMKIIGNTGYFVLTGTDAQLATQLNELTDKNVSVQKCVLLEPGRTDNLERQLEELDLNREQILHRMHDKHNMLAQRHKKRVKKVSRKYT
ncbi:hypothetical protein KR222_010195 [Zaprionus bogoriensis]|nr:hypothetical protein KR222_010195 [Zaprionus bogoriensis]